MTLFSKQIWIGIFALTAAACSGQTDRPPPETASDVLNERVQTVPYQYIQLDDTEVQEILISEDDIIYDVNREPDGGEPFIRHLSGFTYSNKQLYIYDLTIPAMFIINDQGTAEGPVTREGRGPGEHQYVQGIETNSRYVYVADGNNGRINRYTFEMHSIEPLTGYSQGRIGVNDEIIAVANRPGDASSSGNEAPRLVSVHSVDNLSDTLAAIMPGIVPTGYQPAVYNSTMFSVNPNNDIAASYRPLPWIFLHDEDFKHQLTLILESDLFEKLDIPPLNVFRPINNAGVGGTMPLFDYRLNSNHDLFILMPDEVKRISSVSEGLPFAFASETRSHRLVHLSQGPNKTYTVKGMYTFRMQATGDRLLTFNLAIAEEENTVYIGNRETIFRFALPE